MLPPTEEDNHLGAIGAATRLTGHRVGRCTTRRPIHRGGRSLMQVASRRERPHVGGGLRRRVAAIMIDDGGRRSRGRRRRRRLGRGATVRRQQRRRVAETGERRVAERRCVLIVDKTVARKLAELPLAAIGRRHRGGRSGGVRRERAATAGG